MVAEYMIMTEHEFNCWLQGYITLSNNRTISSKQLNIVLAHSQLVEAVQGEVSEEFRQLLQNISTSRTIPKNLSFQGEH